MTSLSVIIPLAPGEQAYALLLTDLLTLPESTEIIFVDSNRQDAAIAAKMLKKENTQCVTASPGRAQLLNAGAKVAQGHFLWFLHADSRFAPDTVTALDKAIAKNPDALLFFDLTFLDDGPRMVKINALGARFRSRVLGIPFGDQGFCIAKEIFDRLGGYPEDAAYGEDHLFVWHTKQQGIAVRPIDAALLTSARKYQQHGWLFLTMKYQVLWLKQAFPQWLKWVSS